MKERAKPDTERRELVYQQINGVWAFEAAPGIHSDRSVDSLLSEIYDACVRICARTGLDPRRDPDLDQTISQYEALCRECGMLMYDHGWQDGHDDALK